MPSVYLFRWKETRNNFKSYLGPRNPELSNEARWTMSSQSPMCVMWSLQTSSWDHQRHLFQNLFDERRQFVIKSEPEHIGAASGASWPWLNGTPFLSHRNTRLPQPAPSRKVLSLHCFKVLHRILATSFSIIHPSTLPSGIFLRFKCLSCYSLRQLNPKFAIWGNLLFLMLSQIQILYFEIDSSQDFCVLVGHLAVCPSKVFSRSVFQLPISDSQKVLQITSATASVHSPIPSLSYMLWSPPLLRELRSS